MYRVIKYFTDLQDNNYPYEVGSTYPREGLLVSKERLAELSSKNNKQSTVLIVKVSDDNEGIIKADTKPEIKTEVKVEKVVEEKPKKTTKKTTKKKTTKKDK